MKNLEMFLTGLDWDEGRNIFTWRLSSNGVFTVRSAYDLIMKYKFSNRPDVGEQSSMTLIRKFWNTIWKCEIPNKIKIFCWRLYHEALPNAKNLIRRGLEVESYCQICGGEGESAAHIVKDCWWARALRIAYGFHSEIPEMAKDSIRDWMWCCVRAALIGMNILNLYGRSNQIVWVGDALVESGNLSGADGGYKISCDCSWDNNSDTMGIGVVVSKQGKENGYSLVIFQVDSADVYKALCLGSGVAEWCMTWLAEATQLLNLHRGWSVTLVGRGSNRLADLVAHKARQEAWRWVDSGAIPRWLGDFVWLSWLCVAVLFRLLVVCMILQMSTPTEHESQPSSEEASSNPKAIRSKTDPAWGHCKQLLEDAGKIALLCIHCNKIIRGGGINRFKCHLTREKGQVEQCKKVSPDIQHQMRQSIDAVRSKKRRVEEEYEDSYPIHEQALATPSTSQKGKGKKSDPHISNYFMPRTIAGAQPTIKSVMQSKEVMEKCDIAISKWMIDASVPFNAVNSTYFQPMINAISSMGAGYKALNFYRVRGHLLNHWVGEVNKLVKSYRDIWKNTGYTLMADGWTDCSRQSLINFLVYCPKGTIFLKSIDASDVSKTTAMLHKLFKEVILYVGVENIIHIVTDNAANYVAADRLLEAEFPKLFWSLCAAHCINLMFQDIGKLEECGDIVRLTEPLVRVLRIVDSEDKPAISFLYRAIYKAREEMVYRFRRNKKKVEPYLEILDRCWDLQLQKNLHSAGYWLNPAIQLNNDEFDKHRNTISGLLDVIERYSHGDVDLQSKLTSEMRLFKNAEGDFGRQTAIHDRNTMIPEHQKLNDLVYVRYNLRLQQRKQLRHQNYDPINIETLDDHSDCVMEESPPYLTNEEVDALRNDLSSMTIQPVLDDTGEMNLDDNEDENEDEEAHDNTIERRIKIQAELKFTTISIFLFKLLSFGINFKCYCDL
ncbi:hypothetical protein QQ045_004192 [Rhodiola kirilowii]